MAVSPKPIIHIQQKSGNNLEQFILTRNLDLVTQWQQKQGDSFGTYRTFRQINGESHEVVTRLKGMPDLSIFKRMRTSVLSLMQPKIRIYKVTYVEERPIAEGSATTKTVKLPVPCYREFKFSDNFGMEYAPNPMDYLEYESTKPSFRNVGLESFSFESLGADHGALQKEINAKIVLTFKSLKDLQAQPPGEPHPKKGGLRYLDLFSYPPALLSGTNRPKEVYNPKHYQIKVLMGWTAPTPSQLSHLNLSAQEAADIRRLETLNMILNLGLEGYDLDIKENGSVKVSVSFKSYIDTTLDSSGTSIFADNWEIEGPDGDLKLKAVRTSSKAAGFSGNSQKISSLKKLVLNAHEQLAPAGEISDASKEKLLDNIKNDEFFYRCLKETAGRQHAKAGINASGTGEARLTEPTGETFLTWLKVKKNADKFIKKMKAKNADFKDQIFPSFMRELIIGFNGTSGSRSLSLPATAGAGSRLFTLTANVDEIKDAYGIVYQEEKDDPTSPKNERDDKITSHSRSKEERTKRIKISRLDSTDSWGPEQEAATASDLAKMTPKEREATIKGISTVLDAEPMGHTFNFVFLGDIIELAARNSGLQMLDYKGEDKRKPWLYHPTGYAAADHDDVDYPFRGFRLLFGPLEYMNLDSKIKTMNLSQFPISFNLFRAWYLEKIVDQNRTNISVHSFIRKLVDDLVLPSLGGAVPVSFKVTETLPSFHGLTLPGKQTDQPAFEDICGRKGYAFEELLPNIPTMDVRGPEFIEGYYRKAQMMTNSESRVKTSIDYLLYQVTTRKHLTYRSGNPIEDEKDGILHFSIGSDIGMLKKMKFSQVKMPYRVEFLHEMATNQDMDQIEQLVYPYNTDVTLIGIPIFSPGMIYYVNPSLAGLGNIRDANSIARKLNLGGYNFAKQVTMKIDKRGFETTLRGEFQGHPKGGGVATS